MRAKKSLGQNFLKTQSVVDDIITTANIDFQDTVLEIGPGKGVLTEELLKNAGKVIAVEKDDELFVFLENKFKKEILDKKLKIINKDILNLNLKKCGLKNKKYKIVANIPYNITGAILKLFLSNDIQPFKIVLLVQKEVAERIAKSKKESVLSISVKAYGEPKYIQTVKKGNFNPMPKIDSAILLIDNISKNFFSSKDSTCWKIEKRFFEIVKAGFAHKRKFLINNLSAFADKEKLKKIFSNIGHRTSDLLLKINEKTRAENVSLEEWKQITREIEKLTT